MEAFHRSSHRIVNQDVAAGFTISQISLQLANGFGLFFNFLIGGKFRDSLADFWVDELNVVGRRLSPVEISELATGEPLISRSLAKPYADLTPAERQKYKAKLVRQAKLMYDYFKPKSGTLIIRHTILEYWCLLI